MDMEKTKGENNISMKLVVLFFKHTYSISYKGASQDRHFLKFKGKNLKSLYEKKIFFKLKNFFKTFETKSPVNKH